MNYYIFVGAAVLLFFMIGLVLFFVNKQYRTETPRTETPGTGIVIRQQDNSTVPCVGNDCFYLLD